MGDEYPLKQQARLNIPVFANIPRGIFATRFSFSQERQHSHSQVNPLVYNSAPPQKD